MKNLIVILCQNQEEASKNFRSFLDYIDGLYPWNTSTDVEPFANMIKTYEGITYIFAAEWMRTVYSSFTSDFIYSDEFMEDIDLAAEDVREEFLSYKIGDDLYEIF